MPVEQLVTQTISLSALRQLPQAEMQGEGLALPGVSDWAVLLHRGRLFIK